MTLAKRLVVNRTLWRWGGALYVGLLGVILLAPFDFRLPGEADVQWLRDEGGVELRFTTIRSLYPPVRLHEAIVAQNHFSVELWAEPTRTEQRGPARLVSYSADKFHRNFTIGQERDELVVRLRTTRTDLNGKNPELRVADIFRSGELRHIVVVFDSGTEQVYVDGQKRGELSDLGDLTNWDSTYFLLLGNEATGNRPWLGRLFVLAVYDRPLSQSEILRHYDAGPSARVDRAVGLTALYTFETGQGRRVVDRSGGARPIDLEIVGSREISGRVPLIPPGDGPGLDWRAALDVVANILIFIPLGGLLAISVRGGRALGWRAVLGVAAVAACLSLVIELAQYFSWFRTSSWIDVVSNTVGGVLGAATFGRGSPTGV